MMSQHTAFPRPQKKRVRFKGICADAEALGVHRSSLYRVLVGQWDLPGLKKAYEKLQVQKSKRGRTAVAA